MRAGSSAVVHMASVKWDSADKKIKSNQEQEMSSGPGIGYIDSG